MEKKVLPERWYIKDCTFLREYFYTIGMLASRLSDEYGWFINSNGDWDSAHDLYFKQNYFIEITMQEYIDSLEDKKAEIESERDSKITPLKEDSEKPNAFYVTEMRGEDFKSLKVGDKIDMGDFTVEAFSNNKKGSCAECVFKGTENYNICNKCHELIDDNLSFKLVENKEMNVNSKYAKFPELWYIVGSKELREYMRKNKCFDQSFDKENIGYYRNMGYWDCFILDEKSSGAVEISLQDYLRYIGESSTKDRNTKLQEELESLNTDLDKIIDDVHPFEKIAKDLFELYKRKNKDYGDSFSKGFSEYGIIMPCTRLEDKFLRFKQLAKGFKPEVQDEKIEDTLVDMANYAIMTLIELKKKSNEDE